MSARKENAVIAGVGVAACAACCAGPILGVLAGIGLGTAGGFAVFGAVALVMGALVATVVIKRRRRRSRVCSSAALPELVGQRGGRMATNVPVTLGSTPRRAP